MVSVRWRYFEQRFFYILCIIGALASSLMLVFIVGYIFISALPSLSLYFIITAESETPKIGQAIGNAIAGTILISVIATMLATPVSIGTAIYLQRYAKESRAVKFFRYLIEVLSGTPSIILGIFGLLVIALYLGPFTGGFSLISGSIALAILIIPVIERAAEDAIEGTDKLLEEGSYALGATKWETVKHITIPAALSGILTGIMLGFGRAAEESAVVILTAGYSQFMPEFAIKHNDKLFGGIKIYPLHDVIGTLPYSVYHAYENSNVIPMSNGFAAAFILICIVLCINVLAKLILSRTITSSSAQASSSWKNALKAKIFPQKKEPPKTNTPGMSKKSPEDLITSMLPTSMLPSNQKSGIDTAGTLSLKKQIIALFSGTVKKSIPVSTPCAATGQDNSPSPKISTYPFLRTLIPFLIPAALLRLIAFLAGIPPLHAILGPASPSLADLFAQGLALIVVVVGIIFGLFLYRKTGTLQGKTSRSGSVGAAVGICLLLVAGVICSSAASGLFNTGGQPASKDIIDRKAQYAALIAQNEEAEGGSSPDGSDSSSTSSSPPSQQGTLVNTSGGVVIPVKDALSIGESYQYGDATRTCVVKVYDYRVLPFYFWWFIDYNRFVYQIPAAGSSYLVVFIRIENTGTNSAIVPSADLIQVINKGNSYTHEPYFNTSALSAYQMEFYSSHFDQLPYQWIRELGQDKRDYAFLTGYNVLTGLSNTSTTVTGTVTTAATGSTTTGTSSDSANNGKGFFIKPGASNAIDGYLIFEVPDNIVKKDLENTYVGISFNANSGTRWRLETTPG